MNKKKITVLITEDHTIVREGMRALLADEPDIEIVAEAENGREAVELALSVHPDVVVMDIAMPILNGMEATRQILAAAPSTRVLILSAHCDDAYVEHVIALGAAGYLLKQSSSSMLAKAIRDVHRGLACFTPSLSKHLRRRGKIPPAAGDLKSPDLKLTSREQEVLQLVAEGNANKEVADLLHISIKTVEKHRHQVMKKLDLPNIASLTRYAIAHGIIESSVQVTIL
jgi:DNA-binding NarL/FixJ family response regulator